MRDIEILLPPSVDCRKLERIIEEAIAHSGLLITLRGSLKMFPGCIHWHVKQGRAAGTLEVTLWPEQQRAWFTIQDGRTAPWLEGEVERMGGAIQRRASESG